jgi:hypothetical protein
VITAILSYILIHVLLGILFAAGWALFLVPVFDWPVLQPLEIAGAIMMLATLRFYLSPRVTNNNVVLGGGSSLGPMLDKISKATKS